MGKILIVDDSTTDTQYIKSVLADTGHQLMTASDGEEAEKLITSEPFDLIILDVIMPKKSGYQICRDLKRNDKYKDIPIVMMSSKNQQSDIAWGQKQGANEYLTKPCEPLELLLAIKKYIK